MITMITESLFMPEGLKRNHFEYALIHWLAVNAFHAHGRMLKAKEYTPKIAPHLYWARLIVIRHVHGIYEQQVCTDEEQMEILHEYHRKFLCDGSPSPANEILSLLAQGRKQVERQLSHGAVHWFIKKEVLTTGKGRVKVAKAKTMMEALVHKAETIMRERLLFTEAADVFPTRARLRRICDDHHRRSPHYSFRQDPANALDRKCLRIVATIDANKEIKGRMLSRHRKGGSYWDPAAVESYRNDVVDFLEVMLALVHFSGGQPAWGPEMMSTITENTSRVRNICV